MLPGISFIIPAHNRAPLLFKTLSSIFNQKQTPVEVILVDDASQPPLRKVVTEVFPDTIVVRLDHNNGPAMARNIGLSRAKYEYVCFFDSDDLALPNLSQEMLAVLHKHNAPVVCLSEAVIENDVPNSKKIVLKLINWSRNMFLHIYAATSGTLPKALFFAVSTSRIVFPKKILENNQFNETWRQCEEWELLLRVMTRHQVHILPKKLVKFRFSQYSETVKQRTSSGTTKYHQLLSTLSPLEQLHPAAILFRLYTLFL